MPTTLEQLDDFGGVATFFLFAGSCEDLIEPGVGRGQLSPSSRRGCPSRE